MFMDDYNLYGYLLMCMGRYNFNVMSIDDYGLYGSF